MEAAVNMALKEFGGNLATKLQAALEKELAARTANLDEREQRLEARSADLDRREEALERREAGLQHMATDSDLFSPRISTVLLEKPPLQAAAPLEKPLVKASVPLATRPSCFKPGQALQHRNHTDPSTAPTPARAGGVTGVAKSQQPVAAAEPDSPRNKLSSTASTSALFRPPTDASTAPTNAHAGGVTGLVQCQQPDAAAGPNSPRNKLPSTASTSALFRTPAVTNSPAPVATGQRADEGSNTSAPRRSLGRSYSCGPSALPDQTKPGGGKASELRNLFERKSAVARQDSSGRRQSWHQVQNELPVPDGSRTERFRAHEAPYRRTSGGFTPIGAPPEKRSLEELLRADEQRAEV